MPKNFASVQGTHGKKKKKTPRFLWAFFLEKFEDIYVYCVC